MSAVNLNGTVSGIGSDFPFVENTSQSCDGMQNDSTYVVQCNSEVDVHDFAGPLVEEHIVRVAITEAHYVARDAARCHAARVAEAHREPGRRVFVALVECEAQHWPNLLAKRREGLQQESLPFGQDHAPVVDILQRLMRLPGRRFVRAIPELAAQCSPQTRSSRLLRSAGRP